MVDLLIKGLATWRIAHMLLHENGPFRLFKRCRERLGVVYYPDTDDMATYRYEITVCLWCLSMWVGGAVGVGKSQLLLPFAYSALAILVDKCVKER